MKKYLAFISYRHLPDSNDAALRIRKGLEGYHLPKGCSLPKRRRVFRDNDELPTSSDLGMDIENALRDSEYLIALCSEEYLKSKWCLREMETFIESGRKDRILPVLLSGTPETSIPKEIRDLPVAADLRAGTTGGSPKNAAEAADISGHPCETTAEPADASARPYDRAKVKSAIPALLGVMSDMNPERIAGAEFKFRASAVAAAVSFLAAGLLGFAGYASYTADRIAENNIRIAAAAEETAKEERQALKERDTALLRQSEYLAEQAWKAIEADDTDEAIRLALEALPEDLHGDLPASPEAEGVLRVAMSMEMPPSYHLSHTTETDFDICSYYIYPYIDDKLFITGDRFEEAQAYVDYTGGTGMLTTGFAESRQKAIEAGYTKFLHLAGDINFRRHYYYDPGKQLYCENETRRQSTHFTLDGEPFCAAGAFLDQENGDVVAWEDPAATDDPRTVLFYTSKPEAVAVLDIKGIPVTVSFSGNSSVICVVDEAGNLSIFDRKGVKQKMLEGGYTDVYYFYNGGSCACTASEDGTVTIQNLETFEEQFRFQCPSPVRQVRVSRIQGCILVRCDDGVFLYYLSSGKLLTEIGSGAMPNSVLWKNDRGNNTPDTDMILLIYDRRIEFYSIDRDIDTSVTDYLPLAHEGVPKGHSMVYSPDGKRIFQHSYAPNTYVFDPGQDMLYCWDAYTGELLWENANPWYCYRSAFSPDTDGKTVWRLYEGEVQTCIERLDAATGEVLLSARWLGKNWQPMADQPVESPDGTRAFLTMQKSSTSTSNCSEMLLVFDTQTGELLWRFDLEGDSAEWHEKNEAEIAAAAAAAQEQEDGEAADAGTASSDGPEQPVPLVPVCQRQREAGTFKTTEQMREAGLVLPKERTGFAEVMFSKDGKYLYCIQNAMKMENGENSVCVDKLDVETGEVLSERILPIDLQEITLWKEEEACVLIGWMEDEINRTDLSVYSNGEWSYPSYAGAARGVTMDRTVRIFDLARWDYAAKIPFSYLRSPEAYNQPLTAVQSYTGGMALFWEAENGDGEGEAYCCSLAKDGSLGPVCAAGSEEGRRLRITQTEYLHFNGEEAYLSSGELHRLSDGALILKSAWTAGVHFTQTGTGVFREEGSNVEKGIDAAKDGTSVCIFSQYSGTPRTPFLVLPSDLDTLVEKARRRIAARE